MEEKHREGLMKAAELLEKVYPGAKERMRVFLEGDVESLAIDEELGEELMQGVMGGNFLKMVPMGLKEGSVAKALEILAEMQKGEKGK